MLMELLAWTAALWLVHPTQERLWLKNGLSMKTGSDLTVRGRMLSWRDARGRFLSAQLAWVDLARTYAAPPQPEAPPRRRSGRQRKTPWEHPHYRGKTRTSRPIVIEDEQLRRFTEKRPREGIVFPQTASRAAKPAKDASPGAKAEARRKAKPKGKGKKPASGGKDRADRGKAGKEPGANGSGSPPGRP